MRCPPAGVLGAGQKKMLDSGFAEIHDFAEDPRCASKEISNPQPFANYSPEGGAGLG